MQFDLDSLLTGDPIEVTPASPLYDLGDLGQVLKDHVRLVPEASVTTRSDKEFFYQIAGMISHQRVTIHPEYYEDHFEDVELWSPGNPLFPWRTDGEPGAIEGDFPEDYFKP